MRLLKPFKETKDLVSYAVILSAVLLSTQCDNSALFGVRGEMPASTPVPEMPPEPGSPLKSLAPFTANVMAPLYIKNEAEFADFEQQLTIAKGYGVDAVSVDVWWGLVERSADNTFDWSYYDNIFRRIKAKGLRIVAVFSFHKCGGNVGDECDISLPPWLWTKYQEKSLMGVVLGVDGLKYRSEQGNYSDEVVQGWADTLVLNEYQDFTQAFSSHFLPNYANDLQEINVSMGPAGELRYPSYNGHDLGSGYPSRGSLQAYSDLAIKDFQDEVVRKYGSFAAVNRAWGTAHPELSTVLPPKDPGIVSGSANIFFTSFTYKTSQYGKDFIDWYNSSLVAHGQRMLTAVIAALGQSFPDTKIGYKIPSVHWTMTNPDYPRAAEVAAGLIQTSIDFDGDSTGHGYQNIINLATRFKPSGRDIVLHFTALEFGNNPAAPEYSQAENLVFWVANNAAQQSVAIKGENALSGGVTNAYGWGKINNAFDHASYTGLTILRMAQVTGFAPPAEAEQGKLFGQHQYTAFIAKYNGKGTWPSLFLHTSNKDWKELIPMTKSGSTWSAERVSINEGEEFKFDVLGDWTTNYGGEVKWPFRAQAILKGDNLKLPPGIYNISFDEMEKTYFATRVG